jgi:hypothetical protein
MTSRPVTVSSDTSRFSRAPHRQIRRVEQAIALDDLARGAEQLAIADTDRRMKSVSCSSVRQIGDDDGDDLAADMASPHHDAMQPRRRRLREAATAPRRV